MCGINGFLGGNIELIKQMNEVISHRGPDGSSHYCDEYITLGHNRLAIIDLSVRGTQPMKNTDGSLVITYNGELYNFKELKRELSSYHFVSETDTEVILAAYEKWGEGCVDRFNGIFAFAIWDLRMERLFLARDQMGVKPLYYYSDGEKFVFSSEAKAILSCGIKPEINTDALTRYLHVGDPIGNDSMFAGINRLPPASAATLHKNEFKVWSYWQPKLGEKSVASKGELITQIQSTVDSSIERQLVSDRPVGISLSGGIDSSSVLATVSKYVSGIHTFSTRFDAGEHSVYYFNLDADTAKRTAAHFGAKHTEITIGASQVIDLLERSIWHMDEPTGSATALSQLALAEVAVKEVPVLLGGEGNDELWGGYARYRIGLGMEYYQRAPAWLRRIARTLYPRLAKLEHKAGIQQFDAFYCAPKEIVRPLLQSVYAPAALHNHFYKSLLPSEKFDPTDLLMEIDRRLLTDGSLLRSDKLQMAAGVEGRVPLLDLELIELSATVRSGLKVSPFGTKLIFKEAMRDRLPGYLYFGKKRGWVTPAAVWLKDKNIHNYVRSVLSREYYAGTAELFDWAAVSALIDRSGGIKKGTNTLVWKLMALQIWARKYYVTIK